MRKKKWLGAIGGFLFLRVCFGVVGVAVLGKIGYEEFLKSPRLTSVFAYQEPTVIYQFSSDQQGIRG